MSDLAEIVGRTIARREGRAFVRRTTSGLTDDPERVFAIAPIKMVSEEIVQAMAFGDPDGSPTVITRWNPLSRDASDLGLFAIELNDYVAAVIAAQQVPRIWLPNGSALTAIDLLGLRYRTNAQATATLQRMGAQCRALAVEATFEGQQAVAVADALLQEHVLTGQMPVKDGHLGALLAWVVPEPGRDPAEVADERALVPASGVLERGEDDEVESLRRIAKGHGPQAARARRRIERVLDRAARREWERLAAARRAFWDLGLPVGPASRALEDASRDRLEYRLANDLNTPATPHAVSRMIDLYEHATDLAEDARVRDDDGVRRQARAKGRAVHGEVTSVLQPRSSRKPCDISLVTTQPVLRVRRGTTLKTIDGAVETRVTDIREIGVGRTEIAMSVTKGVRRSTVPTVGMGLELVDTNPMDMSYLRNRVLQRVQAAASPLVYGSGLTAPPRSSGGAALSDVADRLRRNPR